MKNKPRIQQVSRGFRFLFTALFFLIPLFWFMYWLFFNDLPTGVVKFPTAPEQVLSLQTRIIAFLVNLIPASVVMFGMYKLVRLFRLYEQAIIFTTENVKYYRTLGYVCFYWVIAKTLSIPFISAVIVFDTLPEQRSIVAQFEFPHLSVLIIGLIILSISWVMDEGRKLEDEQAYTV